MSQTSKVIGQHFSKLRRDYALTQEAFAKRIGVNTSYIGPLERGEKIPSLTMLERVASEFSVPLFTFFINAELEDREEIWLTVEINDCFGNLCFNSALHGFAHSKNFTRPGVGLVK
jgi:transcriptional regulator with XRE-family HTH domain